MVIKNGDNNGVLIKGGNYLEAMSNSDTLILDKTGTLTEGKPAVTDIEVLDSELSDTDIEVLDSELSENDVLKIAGAAEETSSHPMSTAIITEVEKRGIEIPVHGPVITHIARGMETDIDGEKVYVGSKIFLKEKGIDIKNVKEAEKKLSTAGSNLIYVAYSGKVSAIIAWFMLLIVERFLQ